MLSDTQITDDAIKQALCVIYDESPSWLYIAQRYRGAWGDIWFHRLMGRDGERKILQRAEALIDAAICFRLGLRAMVFPESAFLMWGDEYASMPGELS